MRSKIAELLAQFRRYVKLRQGEAHLARYHKSVDWYRGFFSHYVTVHQSIIGLTVFILLSNLLVAEAAQNVPMTNQFAVISEPYQIADTLRLLSPYTPNIEEDPDAVALNLEERTTGSFIATDKLVATQPGVTDEPEPVKSGEPSSDGKRGRDIKYTVQIGDTLSGIGSKYGLKIATIKVKNNLSDVDSIKPGQELTIPVQDLSEKAIQAAEGRKIAQTSQKIGKKIIQSAKASGVNLVVPIRHNGITRGLVGGHTGIDYRADTGSTVFAAKDGVVADADPSGWNGGYGKTILINHGGGVTTRYAHLSSVNVSPGESVGQGEAIGRSGNTGRSTGPHLHFELRINGVPKNPF